MDMKHIAGRRGFIKQTAAMTAGLAGLEMLPEIAATAPDTGVNIIGPKPGYSPQVGTMVSMLTWMQDAVVNLVNQLTRGWHIREDALHSARPVLGHSLGWDTRKDPRNNRDSTPVGCWEPRSSAGCRAKGPRIARLVHGGLHARSHNPVNWPSR
jgi:hypothetical protein